MNFITPVIYLIAVCFLVSLSVYSIRGKSFAYLKLFPPFLLLTLVSESLGAYWEKIGRNNLMLYNLFSTFEICYYLMILSLMIANKKWKRIIRLTIPGYALLALANIFFIQKRDTFHTMTYTVGCLLIVSFCFYYFLELFRVPTSEKLLKNPAFWICSGLLFFYICGFPLFGLINYWGNISKLVLNNFDTIVMILNFFLYTLLMIAFLCRRTMKFTSLLS